MRCAMIMKVFNKGQIVIPVSIRRALDIDPGDMLDVRIDEEHQSVELRKTEEFETEKLAGSLAKYGEQKRFPSREEMNAVFRKGMSDEA